MYLLWSVNTFHTLLWYLTHCYGVWLGCGTNMISVYSLSYSGFTCYVSVKHWYKPRKLVYPLLEYILKKIQYKNHHCKIFWDTLGKHERNLCVSVSVSVCWKFKYIVYSCNSFCNLQPTNNYTILQSKFQYFLQN